MRTQYDVIVVGAGHAGAEAAWAAANLGAAVALVTLDPAKAGVMSCNPSIGGLAKGQIVREIDALGGLMGLAADATGINFKVLNASKGPAVRGPRCQCDKHAYAQEVRRLLATRKNIEVVAGSVEAILVGDAHSAPVGDRGHAGARGRGEARGVVVKLAATGSIIELRAPAVVLTTGTFMRALMHTGATQTPGGRAGEGAAVGISGALTSLGFELGRLKTGTPPRLDRNTIDWDALEPQRGDASPVPFSELTPAAGFPRLEQIDCRITSTTAEAHELIRASLHLAPMFNGQIAAAGPRYCPSIEDKVVRFADRAGHHVFLEPESLRDDSVYANGISTSLPADVQLAIVRAMPGCARAKILKWGYAVEYDMVRPHQIDATCMTKRIAGLFLAGQINGTSGYEEAAAQGLLAGLNAARSADGLELVRLGRDEAYIGVLMDDLVTKTPVEPYRMFTSRAEHRLLLRADNAPDRLTPRAHELGLIDGARRLAFERRRDALALAGQLIDTLRVDAEPLRDLVKRPGYTERDLETHLTPHAPAPWPRAVLFTALADRQYEGYIKRQRAETRRHSEMEHRRIPAHLDPLSIQGLRAEARHALSRFRPATFGQAGRLEGVTPADITLLLVAAARA